MKRDFISHLSTYLVVNAMLILLWVGVGRGYPWFIWPLCGWGIGILAHGVSVAVKLAERSDEEAVEREMKRMPHSPR
jgi:hypothetical protein